MSDNYNKIISLLSTLSDHELGEVSKAATDLLVNRAQRVNDECSEVSLETFLSVSDGEQDLYDLSFDFAGETESDNLLTLRPDDYLTLLLQAETYDRKDCEDYDHDDYDPNTVSAKTELDIDLIKYRLDDPRLSEAEKNTLKVELFQLEAVVM